MNPCSKCTSKCCRYFVMELDAPKTKRDFENIRWYLAHEDIEVYIEKRKWFLEVKNKCMYLSPKGMCKIYDRRPLVCREHDPYSCEHHSDEYEHSHVFKDIKEFDKYLQQRFKKRKNANI